MTTSSRAGKPCHHTRAGAVRRAPAPLRTCAVGTLALALAGCATGPRNDPFEPYNRSMAQFNEAVDTAVLRPVAQAYTDVTPAVARAGVSNFFANLGDAWSFVNNVLQLRAEGALNSLVRFNVNTVFGIGGLFDVASEMGIDRAKQDFGLTLGRWGVPPGPYLVLPLLGPSTVRDTLALPVDWQGNLLSDVRPVSARNSLYGLRVVDTRANLLRAGQVLDAAALDKYSFTRDVYLRLREQRSEPPGPGQYDENGDDDSGMLPPEPDY